MNVSTRTRRCVRQRPPTTSSSREGDPPETSARPLGRPSGQRHQNQPRNDAKGELRARATMLKMSFVIVLVENAIRMASAVSAVEIWFDPTNAATEIAAGSAFTKPATAAPTMTRLAPNHWLRAFAASKTALSIATKTNPVQRLKACPRSSAPAGLSRAARIAKIRP